MTALQQVAYSVASWYLSNCGLLDFQIWIRVIFYLWWKMKGNSPIVSQKRVFWQVKPPHECGLIGSCEKVLGGKVWSDWVLWGNCWKRDDELYQLIKSKIIKWHASQTTVLLWFRMHFAFPWLPCWLHRLWWGVKNTFWTLLASKSTRFQSWIMNGISKKMQETEQWSVPMYKKWK